MKNNITPGPWLRHEYFPDSLQFHCAIADRTGKTVCTLPYRVETDANARAIAALPELVQIAVWSLPAFLHLSRTALPQDQAEFMRRAETARAALAKAGLSQTLTPNP